MSDLLTLSLRLSPASRWRKHIIAACICNLLLPLTVGEGQNVDGQVNQKHCLVAQLRLHHNACITAEAALTRLSIFHSNFPSLLNRPQRYFNSFTWGSKSPPVIDYQIPAERFPPTNCALLKSPLFISFYSVWLTIQNTLFSLIASHDPAVVFSWISCKRKLHKEKNVPALQSTCLCNLMTGNDTWLYNFIVS